MIVTATIKAKTKENGAVELLVEKTGADTARLTAKTWKVPVPAATAVPEMSDAKLYDARVSADQNTIACKADAPGPDPRVTLLLAAPTGAAKTVTISIEGTLFKLGDRVDVYTLEDAAFAAIKDFVRDAQYPAMA